MVIHVNFSDLVLILRFYTKRRPKAQSVMTNATHLARDLEMENYGQRIESLEQLLVVEV
jgi:hypothetical protein